MKYSIEIVEISKSDKLLGESDIVVVISMDGERHLFLIEDKIDAVAMPDQHGRYVKRAENLVSEYECLDYNVFLYAPQAYRNKKKRKEKKYKIIIIKEAYSDLPWRTK